MTKTAANPFSRRRKLGFSNNCLMTFGDFATSINCRNHLCPSSITSFSGGIESYIKVKGIVGSDMVVGPPGVEQEDVGPPPLLRAAVEAPPTLRLLASDIARAPTAVPARPNAAVPCAIVQRADRARGLRRSCSANVRADATPTVWTVV